MAEEKKKTKTKSKAKPKTKTKSKSKTKTKTKAKSKAKTGTKKSAKSTKTAKKGRYFEGVGRRKTSIARVRIWADDSGEFTVNEKKLADFMPTDDFVTAANAPLRKIKMLEKFKVSAIVSGGGIRGQADAVRHGLARALVEYDPELRTRLKKSGYLKRDPRAKERKKYGLKKARRAPQWSKR